MGVISWRHKNLHFSCLGVTSVWNQNEYIKQAAYQWNMIITISFAEICL